MKYLWLIPALLLFIIPARAASVSVDSVTVDSVWNSDSSWYDINGVPQQITSRDFQLSFIPQGYGMASCSIKISIDSGKTWGPSPILIILNESGLATVPCGRKSSFHCRVYGGDREGVVFKVIANICENISCGLWDLVFSLPGWAAASRSDVRFFGDTISLFVDGGDWYYVCDSIFVNNKRVSTLNEGFYQDFVRPSLLDSNEAWSFVLDYRAAPYALQTYERLKALQSQYNIPVPIGAFDTSVAFGILPNDNYLDAYAHIAQFFVEFRISSRGSNPLFTKDSLVRYAELYFNKFKSPNCPAPEPAGSMEKISITSPHCGQRFLVGDTVRVIWSQTVPSANLTCRFNGSDVWHPFTSVIPGSANGVQVVFPALWYSDSTFQIQVEDNSGTYDPGTVDHLGAKYLVLTYPAATSGGDYFNVGNSVTVSWRAASDMVSSVRVMLSTDGGQSYYDMLTSSIPLPMQSTKWVVGSEQGNVFTYPAKLCRIKINDYNDGNIKDISGLFSVYK